MFACRHLIKTLPSINHPVVYHQTRLMAKKVVKKKTSAAEVDDKSGISGETRKRVKQWIEKILLSSANPEPRPLPEAAQEDEAQFVKECEARLTMRLHTRQRAEQAKINLKLRALDALPQELQEEAYKHDFSLWPLQVMIPTTTPPSKEWLLNHYQITTPKDQFF